MQGYSVYLPHPSLDYTEQLADAKDNVWHVHLTNEIEVSSHRDLGKIPRGRKMNATNCSFYTEDKMLVLYK